MPLADDFKGLPMSELIGAPLLAAATAQFNLADTMVNFIKVIAYKDPNSPGEVLTLPMQVQRPLIGPGNTVTTQTVTAEPPLLGLVPVPALLIDKVTIDFEMEVKQHFESKQATDAKIETKVKGGWSFISSVEVSGSLATHRENTRSTDNSAKYTVHVQATQQPPTEGMSKLMDLLASATEPIKIETKTP